MVQGERMRRCCLAAAGRRRRRAARREKKKKCLALLSSPFAHRNIPVVFTVLPLRSPLPDSGRSLPRLTTHPLGRTREKKRELLFKNVTAAPHRKNTLALAVVLAPPATSAAAMDETGDGALQALERACELHDAVGLAIDNLHRVASAGGGGGASLPRRMSADLETLRLLRCVTSAGRWRPWTPRRCGNSVASREQPLLEHRARRATAAAPPLEQKK